MLIFMYLQFSLAFQSNSRESAFLGECTLDIASPRPLSKDSSD